MDICLNFGERRAMGMVHSSLTGYRIFNFKESDLDIYADLSSVTNESKVWFPPMKRMDIVCN